MTKDLKLKLRRDTNCERAACEGILSLFSDNWEETQKKTAREITALVLMQIKDACVTVEEDKEPKEHSMLVHTNSYLEKQIKLLRSKSAMPMPITGKTYVDTINNLNRIKNAAKGEEFQKDIVSRLNFFIKRLDSMVAEMQVAESKRKKKCLLYSLLGGVAITIVTSYDNWTSDYYEFHFFSEIIIPIIFTVMLYAILFRILPQTH